MSASSTIAADQDWIYRYNTSGQVLTADGPRTDVNDITSYTYDSAGNRTSVTNPLGHVTLMQNHNGRGQAQLIIDANGVRTSLVYHPRGWLLSGTVGAAATTSYTYDNEGQLLSTALPNGSVLYNEYDGAHRLIAIRNNAGERIEFGLDAAGNRTMETTKSPSGQITRSATRTYDELNRLILLAGAGGQTRSYSYDKNGNRVTITDGNMNTTTRTFDGLERLSSVFAPLNHTALYENDPQDNLAVVTDPLGLVTRYTYDGRNNLIKLESPDSGTTSYTYDEANNRLSQTDANGVTVLFTYDALNRMVSRQYPDTALNISYSYDSGAWGKGRLSSITDESGTTTLSYDQRGNVVSRELMVGEGNYELHYAYNETDQLVQIIYPSGRIVDYTRGVDGLISTVSTATADATQMLASNADYLPFGPMNTLQYGNSIQYSGTFDLDYRVTHMTHQAVRNAQYSYDNSDNITDLTDNLNSDKHQIFSYDALNRLSAADGEYGGLSYSYDANGNRLLYTDNTTTRGHTYEATSHRLLSTNNWDYAYDDNGNQISRITRLDASGDGFLYRYNDRNRLVEVISRETVISGNGGGRMSEQIDTTLATYTYNAEGQRSQKNTAVGIVHYIYGPNNLLLAEINAAGIPLREYIYLNGQPLAVAQATITQGPTLPGPETVIDDGGGGTSSTGSWDNIKKKGAYNDFYMRSENTGASYRWTPGNLSNAEYEIYAWWPRTNKNNKIATYTIVHNGQSSTSVQDQSRPGKKWTQLGTFRFDGTGGEYIALSDLGGKTAADGIRLIELLSAPEPVVSTALYFIHNDHLGTPQAITDQVQTVVWSANYKPFGEATINTNTIANNLRFPGQYFDEETGLHQNYFRDYDPGLGRYVQSDPIGLGGRDTNLWAYASNTPLLNTDPKGLVSVVTNYGISSTPIKGFGGEVGFYGTTDGSNGSSENGFVLTGNKTVGFGTGLDATINVYTGGVGNLEGTSTTDQVCIGLCFAIHKNPGGEIIGYGVGVGIEAGFTHFKNESLLRPLFGDSLGDNGNYCN
jgi:RHS repeat-associated protein